MHESSPPRRARQDGWTPERQRGFLEALAQLGIVSAAARAVGMSPKSAYALRKRAGEGSAFAAAWDDAVDDGRSNALGAGIRRAIEGEKIPKFYRGRLIGYEVRYNDRLLIAALRAIDPRAREVDMTEEQF